MDTGSSISRRRFVKAASAAAIGGFSGFGYMSGIEPSWFETTRKTVPFRDISHPIRLLHLSDLHASDVVSLELIEAGLERGLAEKPDLIAITGDFITNHYDRMADYAHLLSRLPSFAPCFACLGNHDGGSWTAMAGGYETTEPVRDLLGKAGIALLFNQAQRISISGVELALAGLGDLWSNDLRPSQALQSDNQQGPPLILLSHNPDSKEALWAYDWDLMLCGHTHGGQLVVPLLGTRPFLPVEDKSFPEGLRFWGRRSIHITRGIGNLHGLRFNCRPEVSILDLVPAQETKKPQPWDGTGLAACWRGMPES